MGRYEKVRRQYENKRWLITLILLFVILGGAFIVTNMTKIELLEDRLSIKGLYGTTIAFEDIAGVSLQNEMPKGLRKDNGIDVIGIRLLGNFSSQELGKLRIYMKSKQSPYLYIELKSDNYRYIILTQGSGQQTEALYKELQERLEK